MTPSTTSLMSNSLRSPSSASHPPSPKRKTDSTTTGISNRRVKRRASKACQCCRARKVRCNVEHGAPCKNCRLDEVPCTVTEGRRGKKHAYQSLKTSAEDSASNNPHPQGHTHVHSYQHSFSAVEALANGSVNPVDILHSNFLSESHSVSSVDQDDEMGNYHVPHNFYQNQMASFDYVPSVNNFSLQPPTFQNLILGFAADLTSAPFEPAPPLPSALALAPQPQPPQLARQLTTGLLPAYIKPLHSRMAIEDVGHLWRKGALTIPDTPFRNALVIAYIEFVHSYMPLIELHEFLRIVNEGSGESGRISLLLFQAVMFTGVAFVDMSHLTAAGYSTRKAARKAFYLKSRALYDFDYESDRVAIVQALLLMTYWYETPDDQKDTWHWMGVAISLAHTIGLHRNPSPSAMPLRKQKLWKRLWWSCFMRDRLVALGMRKPTLIKDEDFDVPMLELEDFETTELLPHILPSCSMLRDQALLSDLAHLCIAKAKLCLCISHVLSAQYSVLICDQGQAMGQDGNTRSSVMLFPKKLGQTNEVRACDAELADWLLSLPAPCIYRSPAPADLDAGRASLVVQRALLHMCYHATLSALHRPQVLPSAETATQPQCGALQDFSRRQVREASREITRAAQSLFQLELARYLPTTGVTVLLPAIIIHLLDIKSPSGGAREDARTGFGTCMGVLELLRDNYAAADFAMQFLGAAMQKAGIEVAESPAAGADAAPDMRLIPPPDSSATVTGAFWDVNGTPGVVGEVTTPPYDEDGDAGMKLGGLGGGEEGVFEEQFGALVDFGEGAPGREGAEMVVGDAWGDRRVYDGDWRRDGGVWSCVLGGGEGVMVK